MPLLLRQRGKKHRQQEKEKESKEGEKKRELDRKAKKVGKTKWVKESEGRKGKKDLT